MNEGKDTQKTNPIECCLPAEGGEKAEFGWMAQCPMAEMCQSMLKHSRMGLVLLIPGLLFVLGGILILLEPTVLVWLMGGTSILLGLVMLTLASFLRKLSTTLLHAPSSL